MHKGVDKKYKDLVDKERVGRRIYFFAKVADIVQKAALPKGVHIRPCAIRLTNVAYSYYYDKLRHTDFHGHNGGPSDAKKLAFMVRWVAKLRPFSVVFDQDVAIESRYHFQNMINSIYCDTLARVILGDEYKVSVKAAEHFMYTLHYGDFSHNMLIAYFERSE